MPLELQILINEYYNKNYKILTNSLIQEFISIIYNSCKICFTYYNKEKFNSIDFFINFKYKLHIHYCSDKCYNLVSDNNKDKKKYITSITNYLKYNTIIHKNQSNVDELMS